MNPVIIIPTYISSRKQQESTTLMATYDHTTPISGQGELGRCLESIQSAQGNVPVIILVASDLAVEKQAADKVQAIASKYPGIQSLVIGAPEQALVHQRIEQLGLQDYTNGVGLVGYSAIRNLGLVIATVFGFDAAVFVDDDEIVEDPEFMKKAVYGLGKLTKKGIPIIAKTGYFLDKKGSFKASEKRHWYDCFWEQNKNFNQWISKAMAGPRLSRASSVCGGCLALHKQAFSRLAFDPWITRGEDLDYLLNLRMYGSELWFDNKWCVRHLPPESTSEGMRFRQDIYRWLYEVRKLEFSRTQIDLLQVKPASLNPYPGPFLTHSVRRRIAWTARLRGIARPDHGAYFKAAVASRRDADEYASANCSKYFEFQYIWPELMSRMEDDAVLRTMLVRSTALRRGIDLSAQLAPSSENAQVGEGAGAAGAGAAGAGAAGAAGAGAGAGAAGAGAGAGAGAAAGAAAGASDAASAAANAAVAGIIPVSYDPGMTCQIRLDMED